MEPRAPSLQAGSLPSELPGRHIYWETSSPITSWQIDGETLETVADFIFLASRITADGDCSHKIETLAPRKKNWDKSRQQIKKQRHYFVTKVCIVKARDFPVVVYGCESWTIKKAERRRIDTFDLCCWRRLLRVPWTARRSNQSVLKGNQSWIFTGRTDAKAETPVLWPPDGKNWLIGKETDAGKDLGQEKKGTTEDEMVGWHHRLNGHEFE